MITTGEGNAVAGALEKKKAVILANHGILYVLPSSSTIWIRRTLTPSRVAGLSERRLTRLSVRLVFRQRFTIPPIN